MNLVYLNLLDYNNIKKHDGIIIILYNIYRGHEANKIRGRARKILGA